jgi:hypothetical protein
MLLDEDIVYVGTKAMLRRLGWTLLAGQPPSGCDHLPVVEVKRHGRTALGSKGAFKPDIIAHRGGVYLLVECKPDHSEADILKLRHILATPERVSLLFDEVLNRHLLERHGLHSDADAFRAGLRGAIAHSGAGRALPDLAVLLPRDMEGHGNVLAPTRRDLMLEAALQSAP